MEVGGAAHGARSACFDSYDAAALFEDGQKWVFFWQLSIPSHAHVQHIFSHPIKTKNKHKSTELAKSD